MSRFDTSSGETVFQVDAELEKQTVATLLRRKLQDRSWSQIRKLIESRYVTINGNLCVDAGAPIAGRRHRQIAFSSPTGTASR